MGRSQRATYSETNGSISFLSDSNKDVFTKLTLTTN